MATQKVRRLKRQLSYTATWLAGTLTVTTTGSHYLKTTDEVTFIFPYASTDPSLAVTVTAPDTFTVLVPSQGTVALSGVISIPYFSTGQTGDQTILNIDRSLALPAIVQFTALGAAGAVIIVNVSNDGLGWVPVATVTLASSNLATDFVSIAPQWTQLKLTITSIGVNTAVVATVTS